MPLVLSSIARFDRWQRRIDFRRAVRRGKTLAGVVFIVFVLLSLPSIYQLMRDGPFAGTDASAQAVLGGLMLAHVAFLGAFAGGVWASVPTGLVLRFQHAPLRAHGAILPTALLHEVAVVGIGRSALITLALFYGLQWRLLRTLISSPLEWAVHVALMLALFAVLGAYLFGRVRSTILRAPGAAVRARAMRANKNGVLGALVSLIGGFGAEAAFGQKMPAVLEALGEAGTAGIVLLIPPLHAVTSGSWVSGAVWVMIGTLTTVVLVGAALRSAPDWVPELVIDQQAAPSFTPARLRSLMAGRGSIRRASAFAAKDLLVPVFRAPARYFLRQWFTLASALMILVLVRLAVPGARGGAAFVLLPVLAGLCALLQATNATLHLLGGEGRRIALLLPVLSSRMLLLLKGAPALVFVALHALVDALLLVAAATVLGFAGVPVGDTLGVAVVGGVAFAALGVAIGFLLPDYERRALSNPGASLAGRFSFVAAAGFPLAIYAFLRMMVAAGSVPYQVMPAAGVILLGMVCVMTVAVGVAATSRFSRLEI